MKAELDRLFKPTKEQLLKRYEYFRKSFEEAKCKPGWQEQLALLKAIPNFDAKIFEEISGIREEELV